MPVSHPALHPHSPCPAPSRRSSCGRPPMRPPRCCRCRWRRRLPVWCRPHLAACAGAGCSQLNGSTGGSGLFMRCIALAGAPSLNLPQCAHTSACCCPIIAARHLHATRTGSPSNTPPLSPRPSLAARTSRALTRLPPPHSPQGRVRPPDATAPGLRAAPVRRAGPRRRRRRPRCRYCHCRYCHCRSRRPSSAAPAAAAASGRCGPGGGGAEQRPGRVGRLAGAAGDTAGAGAGPGRSLQLRACGCCRAVRGVSPHM